MDCLTVTPPDHAPTLFSPFDITDSIRVPNRFFKSAMSEVMSKQGINLPTQDHIKVYERWSMGGTAVLVTGNVMIDRTALGEPGNVVLEQGTDLAPFKEWTEAVHAANPDGQFWMQINHPGKQSPKFLTPQPVAPSAVALGQGLDAAFARPRALEPGEILEIIERFAQTAKLAQTAGFDGVQIHGAHGYLVNQFLSPHHNRREDAWGGSPAKRRAFVLEILRAIRREVGAQFPVSIKMNSADFQKGGFEGADAQELIRALSDEGIDLIEISGGNYESPAMTGARQSTKAREAYFLDFAAQARALTDVPIVVTGGFRSVAGMEEALASGATDFVGIARALTVDPELPQNAARDPNYYCEVGRATTGIRKLDKMFMLAITYYETQIRRMANGKDPDPNISPWRAVVQSAWALGAAAFRKRR